MVAGDHRGGPGAVVEAHERVGDDQPALGQGGAVRRERHRRLQARVFLFATALLGLLFLGFQSFEFTEFYHKGLTLQQNLFGSTFFVLTGFHGTQLPGELYAKVMKADADGGGFHVRFTSVPPEIADLFKSALGAAPAD